MKESIPDTLKHFCILPWIHLYIGPNGSVNPCCANNDDFQAGDIRSESLIDIWNSNQMKTIRQEILAGKIPEACMVCAKEESLGFYSDRLKSNKQFPDEFHLTRKTYGDGSLKDFKLKSLDIRFSNHCNLSCRICRPNSSTSWYPDAKFLGMTHMDLTKTITPTPGNVKLMEEILPQLNNLEKIFFAGGEPLQQVEHYRLLEKLIEIGRTDIILSYATNFSTLKYLKWDALQLWTHFKSVHISASLDGTHSQANYLRKGSSWDIIEENFNAIKLLHDKILFGLITTISIHNVFHMLSFLDYMVDKLKIPGRQINFKTLTAPSYYSIQVLPLNKKEEINKKIIAFTEERCHLKDDPDWQHIFSTVLAVKNYMNERDQSHLFKNFVSITNRLDFLRGESFISLFPEFKDCWNEEKAKI